jgi:hypothetical protein
MQRATCEVQRAIYSRGYASASICNNGQRTTMQHASPIGESLRLSLALARCKVGRSHGLCMSRATVHDSAGLAEVGSGRSSVRIAGRRIAGCLIAGCRIAGCRIAGCRIAGCRIAGCRIAGCRIAGCRIAGCRMVCGRSPPVRIRRRGISPCPLTQRLKVNRTHLRTGLWLAVTAVLVGWCAL